MAGNPRLWASLPLVGAFERAHHAPMTIFVLLIWAVAVAILAQRYGVDSRCR
jgi:hypothetical protein